MQRLDGRFVYSASDLNDYLECRRLTELEALVAAGRLARPKYEDRRGELVRRKGEEHEQRHLAGLLERYPGEIVQFDRSAPGIEAYRQAEAATLAAMRSGARVIYQATFFDGEFIGHADFLRRVPSPSQLGNYSYEVVDTKLALSPKAYYLIQLCNYGEHLQRLQADPPEFGHVVLGDGAEARFRMSDFMAYYRHLKRAFLDFAAKSAGNGGSDVYPFKCGHCQYCSWDPFCSKQRKDDDHLGLVAWMRRDQIAKFAATGITRVTDLAAARDEQRPLGMNLETFEKLRRQADLQVRGRSLSEPLYELIRHEPPMGFALLPPPSAGDVFFDMEGDPLYEPGRGLEYLFGCWMPDDEPQFRAFWGTTREAEKRAFEEFVDFIVERRMRFPAMHVYHYAPYEKSALRRLAQEHRTREGAIDALLRDEVLVDLFAVVRQTLVISEDGYGLKKVEKLYRQQRDTEVKKGDESIVMFEQWLLDGDRRILDDIESYNRDDCHSTYLLREYLLAHRLEASTQFGIEYPFRPPPEARNRALAEAEDDERSELERTLLAGILSPKSEDEYRLMQAGARAQYLLANLLAYHKREEKPQWWALFDRCDNVDRLLEFDREAIAGMRLREDVPPEEVKRSKIYTYSFPDQHHKMGPGDAIDPRTGRSITITTVDDDENRLRVKTTLPLEEVRALQEVIPGGPPSSAKQRAALARIARAHLDGSLSTEYPATRDLLFRSSPRLSPARREVQPAIVDSPSVSAAVSDLDRSYLFIQGPPGSGKSTIGSEVICDLLQHGKRVAVTSTSHAAIHNLLHKVEACLAARGVRIDGGYKHGGDGSEYRSKLERPMIRSSGDNADFENGDHQLVGGTAWLFAREALAAGFDYLFVDEAGQVSLADALVISLCARNVVLLGDPSQLAQVSQGRQPLHAGDSVLQHLLGDEQTVARDRGIFLDRTYRMQPEICAYISDLMYEGRLQPSESAREHRVAVDGEVLAGLYFVPVVHSGNGSSSEEEATEIVRRIQAIHPYESDLIVVTPYNAQRRLIAKRLATAGLGGVPVGTVDKFQGQQAAVVFYSMATSSGEDLPRNMEFLFEKNRFNVAISRAKAASFLVCNPALLDVACRSPEEMALVNLLCAFAERATVLAP